MISQRVWRANFDSLQYREILTTAMTAHQRFSRCPRCSLWLVPCLQDQVVTKKALKIAFIDCLHKVYASAVISDIVFVSFIAFVVSFLGGEYLRPRRNVESFVARRSKTYASVSWVKTAIEARLAELLFAVSCIVLRESAARI